MTDAAPALVLDYGLPGSVIGRRDQIVLWLSGLAAAVLALKACAQAMFVVLQVAAGRAGDLPWWQLVWFASLVTGPLLIICTIAALRRNAIHRAVRVRRLFFVAFVLATAVEVELDVRFFSPLFAGLHSGPDWFAEVADLCLRHATPLCLLMPLLLLGVDDVFIWRRRAMILAAWSTALCGLAGIDRLLQQGILIQNSVGGTIGDGVRAALQRPLPIVGMWPLLGLASAGLLFGTIAQPRRVLVGIAAAAGLIFSFVCAGQHFYWVMPGGLGDVWWTLQVSAVSSSMLLLGAAAIPLWLLAWATTSRRSEIFADEASGANVPAN